MSIKDLEFKRELAWYSMQDEQKAAASDFSVGYIDFLNKVLYYLVGNKIKMKGDIYVKINKEFWKKRMGVYLN